MNSKRWGLFVVGLAVLVALGAVLISRQPERIAILSAFGAELEALRTQATIDEVVIINGRSVYVGTLAGHPVVMTLTGGSMVNATMSTEAILSRFNIKQVVFSGIAGGVNPELDIGDVVVPAQWAEYQENFFVRETSPGIYEPPPWFKPTLPSYGMMYPQGVYLTLDPDKPDEETQQLWLVVDSDMLAVAQTIAGNVTLEQCAPEGECLSEPPIVKVGGNGVAGPTFVDNAAYREYVYDTWQADSLDMESSAVAHVAVTKHVPFIIFRSLSDLAGGGPGENEIGIFFQLAANNSAKVMLAFLEALP